MVTAQDPYGHGMMHIADIRGWGHLTGKGSCALSEGQACAIQEANSFLTAAARTALPAALDALEAAYAEIERLTHDYAASAKRLIDEKDRLTAELAAEKRRADAAEKDLYRIAQYDYVSPGAREYAPLCALCKMRQSKNPICNQYGTCCFDWRGPCAENAPTGAESEEEHAE
jgi:hypothetical protein